MDDFEKQLSECRGAVERLVHFRVPSRADAEDLIQEICWTAYRHQSDLRDPERFRPWILQIARNRINDFFRTRARRPEIAMSELPEPPQEEEAELPAVAETLLRLEEKDREILHLCYWLQLPQLEIARRLSLPLGTVKSRLFAAKNRFRALYPLSKPLPKGEKTMTKLPESMLNYTIMPSEQPPFEVRCEELMGWNIIPRLGEKLSWGLYESPGGSRTEYTDMRVVGEAEVHGIRGVEIVAVQHDAENYFRTGSIAEMERRFVAQLTDTHCRFLAESHVENGVRKCFTFLDGEPFLNNWGFGEDNCGSEVLLRAKGLLRRKGNEVVAAGNQTMDVVGRYTVRLGEKEVDTICLMDVECFDEAIVSEQYVDRNGRTVLWRRFNRDDWALHRYHRRWTEMLPDNERLTVNGETYVHWYDCLTDYVL